MLKQLVRFGAVGVMALAAHWLVVASIVPMGLHPLVANVFAFCFAFPISYFGHRRWTFSADHVPHAVSFPRFLLIACFGFALNEVLYFLLLTFSPMDYRLSLLLVLLSVPAVTFVLSRQWGFR